MHQRVGVLMTSHAFRILCMKVEIMGLTVTYAALKQGLVTIFMTIRTNQIPVFGIGL